MVCSQVRELLLAPEASARAELSQHLSTCQNCARAAHALARLDESLQKAVVVPLPSPERSNPSEWHPGRLGKATLGAASAELALRKALVVDPPPHLQARLQALATVDQAVKAAVIVEPPPVLQARLAALATTERPESWLAGVWQGLRARPGVLAGQLAATAVLAYALVQLLTWVGSLPLILGDVPYALELLVLSPAFDYLGQVETLVQQLGLWLLVGGAGWLAMQVLSRQRQFEP